MNKQERKAHIKRLEEIWSPTRRLDPTLQIRTLMRKKKLTSKDLAERFGVSPGLVSRWLKGESNLKIDTLYKFADALDVPLTIEFGGANETASSN